MENLNDKIFELHAEGVKAGKIAQKLKVKKAVVMDILGEAGKSEGLGSKIEAFTEATGIKAVVEAVVDDCGCAARAEKLNKAFPSRRLNDLSLEDHKWLTDFFATNPKSVRTPEQIVLVRIFNDVFNAKRQVSNCSPCIAGLVKELKKVLYAANS